MKIDIKDIKKMNIKEDEILIVKVPNNICNNSLRHLKQSLKLLKLKGKIYLIGEDYKFEKLNIKANKDILKKLIKDCLNENKRIQNK